MMLFCFPFLHSICTGIMFIDRKDVDFEIYIGFNNDINGDNYSPYHIFEISNSYEFHKAKLIRNKNYELVVKDTQHLLTPLMLDDRQIFEKDLKKNYSESDESVSKLVELLCKSQVILRAKFPFDINERFYITLNKISPDYNLEYWITSRSLKLNRNRNIYELKLRTISSFDKNFSVCIPRTYSEHINSQLEELELSANFVLSELDETIYME
ncbi:uncharacterized protein VNE69_08100 [Vairimorpha necatrix]|uniref:Uncharacterized protein n=1 Tax=Vairimorpha necatrix TaxID=6039 RepID=A0AAX4JET2_9MICR